MTSETKERFFMKERQRTVHRIRLVSPTICRSSEHEPRKFQHIDRKGSRPLSFPLYFGGRKSIPITAISSTSERSVTSTLARLSTTSRTCWNVSRFPLFG